HQTRVSAWPVRRGGRDRGLCQRNGLEGADDVVGAGFGEEAFVKTGAKVPVIALVIFVAIKTPDATDDNDAADAVVPKIAQIMEAEISAGVGAFEADVVVDNDLGHPHMSFERFTVDVFWRGGACVITQRPYFPFRVDDAAVVRRKFGLGYLFSHKQRISLNFNKGNVRCRAR